jgi:hypothetical protein
MTKNVVWIDDYPTGNSGLASYLYDLDITLDLCSTIEDVNARLLSIGERPVDLLLFDLILEGPSGRTSLWRYRGLEIARSALAAGVKRFVAYTVVLDLQTERELLAFRQEAHAAGVSPANIALINKSEVPVAAVRNVVATMLGLAVPR